jgi:hypothetical protein
MCERDEPLVLDGMEIQPQDADGRAWTYVPARPSLEQSPGGMPMLTVLEAGSTAFLQCTARVALNEDARAALLARLKKLRPSAETLHIVPLSVERIALEIKSDGEWVAVAESKGSGMPPWTAALAATLAPGAAAALKSAVTGERDRARLRARIVLSGSPATVRRVEASGTVQVEMPAGAASSSYAVTADASRAATAPTPRDLSADLTQLLKPSGGNR